MQGAGAGLAGGADPHPEEPAGRASRRMLQGAREARRVPFSRPGEGMAQLGHRAPKPAPRAVFPSGGKVWQRLLDPHFRMKHSV